MVSGQPMPPNATQIAVISFRLHRPAYQATFSVQNTGDVFGGEVHTFPCLFLYVI